MTLEQHLAQNRDAIEAEARQYARAYGLSLEQARHDVEEEYKQGWFDDNSHHIYE